MALETYLNCVEFLEYYIKFYTWLVLQYTNDNLVSKLLDKHIGTVISIPHIYISELHFCKRLTRPETGSAFRLLFRHFALSWTYFTELAISHIFFDNTPPLYRFPLCRWSGILRLSFAYSGDLLLTSPNHRSQFSWILSGTLRTSKLPRMYSGRFLLSRHTSVKALWPIYK